MKKDHPDIEWRKIGGMRDKIIHMYFGVNWDIVWDVVDNKLPKLEKDIRECLRDINKGRWLTTEELRKELE